ncbi:ATP-binding protein [Arthrobacter sp. A5]|uniref:ATP-binding protein n=1 Tax=Arthrobacter sp. A5 TaxID=576926 RepID=UPI003DA8EA44
MRIGDGTALHHPLRDAQNVTTVLGNLVDNAVLGDVLGDGTDRWVEVELLSDDAASHVFVADSGNGLRIPNTGLAFREGYTTALPAGSVQGTGHGEGLGLALSRQIARLGGGDVWVLSAGHDGGPGVVFAARLEDALEGNALERAALEPEETADA